jgi:hypothetical protein
VAVVVALALVGGCSGLFLVIVQAFKSTDAYAMVIEEVREDPRVGEALGSPLEPGFLATGNVSVSGGGGTADLAFAVHGPKGEGDVFVHATKTAGKWRLDVLGVVVGGTGRRITIIGDPGGPRSETREF